MEPESESLFFDAPEFSLRKWNGYSFIMPAVSVGNVGQLAIDLLLSNLGSMVEKITVIYDDAILPIVGRDPFQNELSVGLEVFESKEQKLVLLQQRAPFVKGRIPSYRKKLMNWIKQSEFDKFIMLSSVSSHIRKDNEMVGSPFRYLATTKDECEKLENIHQWREYAIKQTSENLESYHLPGAGVVKSLYEECEESGLVFIAFMVFCNPGRSTQETVQIVDHLQDYMKILPNGKLKIPPSWNTAGSYDGSAYIF